MRTIVCGGEALHPPLVKLFGKLLPQARLYNDYGPTEVTVASTGAPSPQLRPAAWPLPRALSGRRARRLRHARV